MPSITKMPCCSRRSSPILKPENELWCSSTGRPWPALGASFRTPGGHRTSTTDARLAPRINHPSIWISYSRGVTQLADLCSFRSHHRLLSPRESWERAKVGAGAPPALTPHGWLLVYHGVAHRAGHFRYSAGAV